MFKKFCLFLFLKMSLNMILFYLFSSILLLSAFMVITVENTVYSVLFLVLCFVMAASLLFLLETEFMSLIFIIIYVGAISVLFLFVIMMLNIKIINPIKDILKYFPIGYFLGVIFFVEILFIIFENYKYNPYANNFLYNYNINWFNKIDSITDIEALGQILYTYYIPQFLISGSILLLAVIGSVILTLTYKDIDKKDEKKQDTFRQISR
jgi:NADH-quinone oxidoreductase subunit J